MKILLNSILLDPVNNAQYLLFKMQTCWKMFSIIQTNTIYFFYDKPADLFFFCSYPFFGPIYIHTVQIKIIHTKLRAALVVGHGIIGNGPMVAKHWKRTKRRVLHDDVDAMILRQYLPSLFCGLHCCANLIFLTNFSKWYDSHEDGNL